MYTYFIEWSVPFALSEASKNRDLVMGLGVGFLSTVAPPDMFHPKADSLKMIKYEQNSAWFLTFALCI